MGGLRGIYSDLSAAYKDDYSYTLPDLTILQEYHNDIPFEEKLYSTYAYAKMIGSVSSFDYKMGTGLLWYPESNTFRPSLEGELIYSSNRLTSAVSAGWSPGLINETIYMERRLDEIYYETETVTTQGNPSMALAFSSRIDYRYSENSSIQLAPYYYDLSGVSLSTSYTDDETFLHWENYTMEGQTFQQNELEGILSLIPISTLIQLIKKESLFQAMPPSA